MTHFIAVFNDIGVFGDTNLEQPSFLSNRSAVEIHLDADPNILFQPTDINIDLPLHARYQVRLLWFSYPYILMQFSAKLAIYIYLNMMFCKGSRVRIF